ncbi:MAG: 2-C-methyl-D-erythritol 4-phosphate cytidylyltransferase [bacterium]|nr:2-C-methyl-D-erythritol 4-phosphate cytidylyltransferase [bacterium]MDD5756790.1 2-C-methyl-D-erythritol 4-phosphate cytidylyltransferase [bacterium]
MKIAAVIVAAGLGKRMNYLKPKQFLALAGKPVLWHTLQRFIKSGLFNEIIVVIHRDFRQYCQQNIIKKYKFNHVTLVVGGKERQDSVYHGLKGIQPCDLVCIHDGVRCLVPLQVIQDTVAAAKKYGAAIAAVPVKDTIKAGNDKAFVNKTIDRYNLWSIQTPQIFDYKLIMKAYKQACQQKFYGTDDAMLIERLGKKVKIVPGSYDNLKITTPIDLFLAEKLLRKD